MGRITWNKNKYHACKYTLGGETFDSRKEAYRYQELRVLLAKGEITDLRRQVQYQLIPSQRDVLGHVIERPVTYVADFVYKDRDGNEVVEDVKGMKTREYVLKRKMMLYIKGIRVKEV
jgi:hypothetical protein